MEQYSTNLTDKQWQFIEKIVNTQKRRRKYSIRGIFDGILYLLKTGCQWRMLPSNFAPWQSVYYYFSKWKNEGIIEELLSVIHSNVRKQLGKAESPSLGIIDSRSVKTSHHVDSDRGIDGNKKIKGRKQHVIVDTLGLPMAVAVHEANIHDSKGAPQVIDKLAFKFPRLIKILADGGYRGVGANPTTLLALSREELSIMQSTRALNTYHNCRCYHRQLELFGKSKGEEDIPLTTLTMEFFDDYRIHFKRKGYALSTTKQNLFWLSRLMYRAISQQTIRYNPFEDAKYERVERKIRCLGKTDVARILAMPLQNKEAEFVRRIFLFSIFTVLAFADVSKLRYCDIETNSAGIRYIRQYRKKTDVESITPLHPIAEQILSLFPPKEKKEDSLIFKTSLSRIQIGMHLKAIGLACGIRQPLSFHVGRHSFGTLTLEAGVPIESIAKMMGHASIVSTQIYAQITDQKISKDMDQLIKKSTRNKNIF